MKCPLDNQEVEDVMEAAVEVAEVENVDPLVVVVEAAIVEGKFYNSIYSNFLCTVPGASLA